MPKKYKNIAYLMGLLAVCIVGQILLKPCLGQDELPLNPPTTSNAGATSHSLQTEQDNLTGLLIRQFILLIVVVAGIAAAGWYLTRRLPLGGIRPRGQWLKIADTIRLSPKKSIHILTVGNRAFLIGDGQDQIRLLAELTGSIPADLEQK